THIEKAIDDISETLPKQFSLMILGNNVISSHINVARTICRRAERCIVAIEGEIVRRDFVSQLLNRLSDYLYVLLRVMMA
ncbi:MAG: ATP:cob(I)alamin adenosyltransferase, partial [Bacteroidales bacterium]|nr:ATP:cob(I)alamin adenosyltransferase [Bacteroidales bacterium]